MAGGRMPDYRLSALNKATGEKRPIGAAWKNDDGHLSIKLDPFIVLTASPDLTLALFPCNERDHKAMAGKDQPAAEPVNRPASKRIGPKRGQQSEAPF